MALNTLLGQATDEQLKKLPGKVRNPDRIKQHLDAFALHLQGVSYRGIQEHFGWKSLSTAQNSVRRGEILAKELKLDSEKLRLKLAAFFDRLCDLTLQQVEDQAKNGVLVHVTDNQGNETITRRRGIDTKLLGEAGRGAIRFAQFAGLMDADSATGGGEVSQNVIFVSPSSDPSEWQAKTVDVTPSGDVTGDTAVTPASEGSDASDELLLNKQSEPDSVTGRPATSGTEGQA